MRIQATNVYIRLESRSKTHASCVATTAMFILNVSLANF